MQTIKIEEAGTVLKKALAAGDMSIIAGVVSKELREQNFNGQLAVFIETDEVNVVNKPTRFATV
jgi:hypothetical protein